METKIYHAGQEVKILAADTDPRASVWVYYVANPDHDAFVLPSELTSEVAA